MKIWLDNIRPSPFRERDGKTGYPFDKYAPYDIHCGNGEDVLRLVDAGVVGFISFDHDLGPGIDGYKVAETIERWAYMGSILPIDYKVHSANPVGRGRIVMAMESAWVAWRRRGYVRQV